METTNTTIFNGIELPQDMFPHTKGFLFDCFCANGDNSHDIIFVKINGTETDSNGELPLLLVMDDLGDTYPTPNNYSFTDKIVGDLEKVYHLLKSGRFPEVHDYICEICGY